MNLFKRKTIKAIFFTDKDGKVLELHLGQKIHLPHEGDCTAEMQCTLSPTIKFSVKGNTVTVETTEASFDYIGVTIQRIYFQKG